MTDMYKCPCCGGNVNVVTMRCEYCGTAFEPKNNSLIRVETYRHPVRTIRARVAIPRYEVRCIGSEETAQLAMSRLQGEIAGAISELMRYDVDYDIEHLQYRVTGEIKAVIPVNNGAEDMIGRLK